VNAADGTSVANYEYGPFGETVRMTGTMARNNPFRFSTKYQDDESDFLYYGYRFYKPSTGTWMSRDSLNEKGGRNLYALVRNRPVESFDVLGRSEPCNPNPTCGEDVTQETYNVLDRLVFYYDLLLASDLKCSACKTIIGLGPYGTGADKGAAGAWGIEQLAWAGFHYPITDTGIQVGDCGGQASVTFQRKCHYAGAVNYIMWGFIMRMCKDSAQAEPGNFESLDPELWFLDNAQTLVQFWNLQVYGIPPWEQIVRSKVGFTQVGYNGRMPGVSVFFPQPVPPWATPQHCGNPNEQVKTAKFNWVWQPINQWGDWPGL
jgi:RHS repeat-associated protein